MNKHKGERVTQIYAGMWFYRDSNIKKEEKNTSKFSLYFNCSLGTTPTVDHV